MKSKLALLSAGLFFALYTSKLSAATITFEGFPFPSAFFSGESLTSDGFVIQNLGTLPAELTPCSPPCADNGTQYLLTQFDGLLRLTHSTGQAFALKSLDAAESFSGLSTFWAPHLVLTGEVVDGATTEASFDLDLINDGPGGSADFQTFLLPPTFANLTALTIAGGGNQGRNDFSIDNLRLTTVPEPSSLVLCSLGVFGMCRAFRLYGNRKSASCR